MITSFANLAKQKKLVDSLDVQIAFINIISTKLYYQYRDIDLERLLSNIKFQQDVIELSGSSEVQREVYRFLKSGDPMLMEERDFVGSFMNGVEEQVDGN